MDRLGSGMKVNQLDPVQKFYISEQPALFLKYLLCARDIVLYVRVCIHEVGVISVVCGVKDAMKMPNPRHNPYEYLQFSH